MCFKSKEIKSIIVSLNKTGDCDFCRCRNVKIYDLAQDEGLDELFNVLLSVFEDKKNLLAEGYPSSKLISIKYEFAINWNIFNNYTRENVHHFLTELLQRNYPEKIQMLDDPVGIREWMNNTFLEANSVLKGITWEQFVNYIKYENRFHSNYINLEVLEEYIHKLSVVIKDKTYYRGRISNEEELNKPNDLSAPPKEIATAGRANSEGIRHLYLASNSETGISEIRPSIGDTVFVGEFPINGHELKVIDFRLLKSLDVFEALEDTPTKFAINLETLDEIRKAISKPVRSGDSKLDYLPTQFIVDFIKSLNNSKGTGYQGIIYESTLSTNGHNMMIFDPEILTCSLIEKRVIKNLHYTHDSYA